MTVRDEKSDISEKLCTVGAMLYSHHLLTGLAGNLSMRLSGGGILVTPTGVHKGIMSPEDIVECRADGSVIDPGQTVSSEFKVHQAIYRKLGEKCGAVIHCHMPSATAWAFARKPLVTTAGTEARVLLGPEVVLVPYATPGTQQLADNVYAAVRPDCRSLLLENHGVVAWGNDIFDAMYMIECLHGYCQTYLNAIQLGDAVHLSAEAVEKLPRVH